MAKLSLSGDAVRSSIGGCWLRLRRLAGGNSAKLRQWHVTKPCHWPWSCAFLMQAWRGWDIQIMKNQVPSRMERKGWDAKCNLCLFTPDHVGLAWPGCCCWLDKADWINCFPLIWWSNLSPTTVWTIYSPRPSTGDPIYLFFVIIVVVSIDRLASSTSVGRHRCAFVVRTMQRWPEETVGSWSWSMTQPG